MVQKWDCKSTNFIMKHHFKKCQNRTSKIWFLWMVILSFALGIFAFYKQMEDTITLHDLTFEQCISKTELQHAINGVAVRLNEDFKD